VSSCSLAPVDEGSLARRVHQLEGELRSARLRELAGTYVRSGSQ
jgi:hypothetical protein